ncbi:peptidoglycan binding protein CsiV [Sulfurivermis fontis]|uniref:peptidoglycan binding protein CsiV n=1 Tax=Sulfurivermis fontis TaxID=1972068 RepID=UPI000FDAD367|nr:peptidoglycan binding protein CsiV [Sulfurivermis fontis]
MKLHGLCAALLCAAITLPVAAAETWYEVEIIVLAQRQPDAGSEVWPVNGLPPLAQETVLAIPQADQPGISGKIAPLPAENLRLQAEAQRIAGDARYELLLHTGWRQPGLPKEQALPVRIQAVEAEAGLDEGTMALPRIDGTLRLILARYLHLEADLRYRSATAVAANSDTLFASFNDTADEEPVYRLNETRRMRSREIHYLDHPMFGIIAVVTPYEQPAAAPVPTASPVTARPPAPVTGTTGTIRRN